MSIPATRISVFALAMAGFAASSLLKAQEPREEPLRIQDGGAIQRLVSIFIPSLPNAPFTATLSTEWVRTYTDGTTITLKSKRMIARDASGRIFQERRWLAPDGDQHETSLMRTEISDPQRHTVYLCIEQERVCQIREFTPMVPMGPATGAAELGLQAAAGMQPLGKQTIAGIETEGWQGSEVLPAQTIGNDSPIFAKREYWYSTKLGFNLQSLRQDPRFGVERFEVTEIVLGDPDPKLFEPASGFEIVDTRKLQPEKQPLASN